MSYELRDAIAAAVEHDADIYQDTYGAADAVLALPEIRKALAVLARIKGGPCVPCRGTGIARYQTHLEPAEPCDECDGTGRTPGIIDRLKAHKATWEAEAQEAEARGYEDEANRLTGWGDCAQFVLDLLRETVES